MKRFLKFGFMSLALLGSALFASCDGGDETGGGNETALLTITPDKASMMANGIDNISFTVKLGEQDVTAAASIFNVVNGVEEQLSDNVFSTTEGGVYSFVAKYQAYTSDATTVDAVGADANLKLTASRTKIMPNGSDMITFTVTYNDEDVTSSAKLTNFDTGEAMSATYSTTEFAPVKVVATYEGANGYSNQVTITPAGFYTKALLIKGTGMGCVNCPTMVNTLERAEESYPDRFVEVAVHLSGWGVTDIMETTYGKRILSMLKVEYYPGGVFDFRTQLTNPSLNSVLNTLRLCCEENPAKTGIKATSSSSNGTYMANVEISTREAGEYYIAAAIVEDGIIASQTGSSNPNYVHDHVFRKSYNDQLYGESLGEVAVGTPATYEIIGSLPSNIQDVTKCRMVIYTMKVEATSTYGYIVDNAVEFPLNGSIDYRFEPVE
jgi:hypothetical protein